MWRAALSDLREAAVDEELDAGHVAALVRSEERDDLGDLVGGARAAGGDLRQHALDEFVHLLLVELESDRVSGRGDDAGADRVDADAPRAQVVGPAARERADRGLGGVVDAEAWQALRG